MLRPWALELLPPVVLAKERVDLVARHAIQPGGHRDSPPAETPDLSHCLFERLRCQVLRQRYVGNPVQNVVENLLEVLVVQFGESSRVMTTPIEQFLFPASIHSNTAHMTRPSRAWSLYETPTPATRHIPIHRVRSRGRPFHPFSGVWVFGDGEAAGPAALQRDSPGARRAPPHPSVTIPPQAPGQKATSRTVCSVSSSCLAACASVPLPDPDRQSYLPTGPAAGR